MEFAAAKKRRLAPDEIAPRQNDDRDVLACFAVNRFNAEAWLATLGDDQLKLYKESIETNRSADRVVERTIEEIREYRELKDGPLQN